MREVCLFRRAMNSSVGSSLRYVFGISDGKLYRSVRVSIFIEMI